MHGRYRSSAIESQILTLFRFFSRIHTKQAGVSGARDTQDTKVLTWLVKGVFAP